MKQKVCAEKLVNIGQGISEHLKDVFDSRTLQW